MPNCLVHHAFEVGAVSGRKRELPLGLYEGEAALIIARKNIVYSFARLSGDVGERAACEDRSRWALGEHFGRQPSRHLILVSCAALHGSTACLPSPSH